MVFFLIVVFILTLIYSYIGWGLIVPAGLGPPWNAAAWLILILFLLLPPISTLLRVLGHKAFWSDLLSWIAFLSLGFFSLVFTFLVARDVTLLATGGVKKSFALLRGVITAESNPIKPVDVDRRRFLINSINLGILGFSGILTGYAVGQALRRPDVVDVVVPIEDLPEDLEGFRIVQITDIHVGSTIKRDFVQTIIDQVNRLAPDVIAFTGDVADGSVPDLLNEVAPLAQLVASHGSFFVTGNHEYYSGAEAWVEEMNRIGFTVLLNDHRILEHGRSRILLAGVTDSNGGRFLRSHASSPENALAGAPSSHIKVLLAHQPRSVFAAARIGFDLQISGHTHGGQFFPWKFLVGLQQPYLAGLHKHEKTWVYVSRGTGYWGPPLRLGAPPEITVITLRRMSVA